MRNTLINISKGFQHHFLWTINYYGFKCITDAFERIDKEISNFPHVTKGRHLYGSIEWRYNNKPIGHIHGNYVVDILFSSETKSQLLLEKGVYQNKYAKNGISVYLNTEEDIELAVKLLTKSYQLVKDKLSL